MELPFLALLSFIIILFLWYALGRKEPERFAFRIISFVLVMILAVLITNEGFTNTTVVAAPVASNSCTQTINCSNVQNSSCVMNNTCTYVYASTGQVTIVKDDFFTEGVALLLYAFAFFLLIVSLFEMWAFYHG